MEKISHTQKLVEKAINDGFVSTGNSGKNFKWIKTQEVLDILLELGYDAVSYNTSPRNGLKGEIVVITKKGDNTFYRELFEKKQTK